MLGSIRTARRLRHAQSGDHTQRPRSRGALPGSPPGAGGRLLDLTILIPPR
jgi:hypothetical protein